MNKKVMNKNILFWILLGFLLTGFPARAECPPDCPEMPSYTFNPDDPASFDYVTGDYSTITDWSLVEWSKIPAHRIPEVPAEVIGGFYSQLSSSQKYEMTSFQIEKSFDQIDDLTKDLNLRKVKGAIYGKFRVEIMGLEGGTNIKGDVLSGISGEKGHITLTNPSYKKGLVLVDEGGNVLFYPFKNKGVSVPKEDKVVVKSKYDPFFFLKEDQEFVVRGTLRLEGGKVYLKGMEDWVDVKGLNIRPLGKRTLGLYFDGKEYEGNYLSLGRGKIIFNMGEEIPGEMAVLAFRPGNDYMDMGEQEGVRFRLFRDKAIIQKREGLITEVRVGEGAELDFMNGINTFAISGDKFIYKSSFVRDKKKESVPMSLLIVDREGKNILGTEEKREKIIFDGQQNFMILPETTAEAYECKGCDVDLGKSELIWLYAKGKLRKLGVPIEGEGAENPATLARMADYLEKLPPKVRGSIEGIEIVKGKVGEAKWWMLGAEADGVAVPFLRRIVINEKVTEHTMAHEAAHTYNYLIESEDKKNLWEIKREIESLREKEGWGYLEKEERERLRELEKKVRVPTFEQKWKRAADVYGKNLGKMVGGPLGVVGQSVLWKDGSAGPNLGFIRAYGANNYWEDVATFVEHLVEKDYEFYRKLINPKSEFYEERIGKPLFKDSKEIMGQEMAGDWARKYKVKLDLLHEYEFIEEEDYQKIVGK